MNQEKQSTEGAKFRQFAENPEKLKKLVFACRAAIKKLSNPKWYL